jgi:hypothetical protein
MPQEFSVWSTELEGGLIEVSIILLTTRYSEEPAIFALMPTPMANESHLDNPAFHR